MIRYCSSQRAKIIRHLTEGFDHLGISEFPRRGITGTATLPRRLAPIDPPNAFAGQDGEAVQAPAPHLTPYSRAATDLPVALIRRRRFACDVGQIKSIFPRIPCPRRGTYRDRHGRWAQDAMAVGLRTRRMRSPRGRQSRVVLTPRRWREALKKLTLLRGDGDKKARSPESARNKS